MRRLIFTLAAVAVTLASAGPAKAGLIGLDSAFPTPHLYNVSTTTGTATPFVTVTGGFTSLTGLAYLNGTLYATDVLAGQGFKFGSIDMATGAFTVINNQGGSANWHGLAANQAGNVLYSIDIDNGNRLVSVTPAGVITTIGPGAGIDGRGMAYDNGNGVLYATGSGAGTSLYTVNTTTGLATLVGSTGISSGFIGLAFDDATGTLYMTAAPGGNGPSNLYTVNTTTGLATLIGATGVSNLDGLEFIPTQAVPAPPAAVLAVLGLASVGGFRRLRAARG
ncbi:MAG: hypothetical protein U0871_14030 [Gemmataceae bacterium]